MPDMYTQCMPKGARHLRALCIYIAIHVHIRQCKSGYVTNYYVTLPALYKVKICLNMLTSAALI